MSLAQQLEIQTRYDQEHIRGTLMTVDLTYTICHPIQGITSHQFLLYWRWLIRDLANLYTYLQAAVENYEIAEETQKRIQRQGRLLRNDRNVFYEYKVILNGIRFI